VDTDTTKDGYLLVTDKGVVLYSAPTLRDGKVVARRRIVVSDPTGTIATDDDGAVVGWTLNAFIVGVPLSAYSGSCRVDLSHLGRVVSVMAIAMSDSGSSSPALYDWWADANAANDRIVLVDGYPFPDLIVNRRSTPRPFPRRVPLRTVV
jgi:hypothetical protein